VSSYHSIKKIQRIGCSSTEIQHYSGAAGTSAQQHNSNKEEQPITRREQQCKQLQQSGNLA
jgi:hypothetical protein